MNKLDFGRKGNEKKNAENTFFYYLGKSKQL